MAGWIWPHAKRKLTIVSSVPILALAMDVGGGPCTAVYTKIVTAMTAEALGGTTVMRHDADTRSIHSNNDWEH